MRLQLLSRLRPEDTQSLQALNRRLWAYVEGEYHQAPHRGLDGNTPLDAWAARAAGVEYVGARADIEDLFLFEDRRQVARDRTVSLHGTAFEVDANLVGRAVVLRFDPERPRAAVQVFADGKRYPDAKPVDTKANCFIRRARAATTLDGVGVNDSSPASAPEVEPPKPQLRLSDLAAASKKGED